MPKLSLTREIKLGQLGMLEKNPQNCEVTVKEQLRKQIFEHDCYHQRKNDTLYCTCGIKYFLSSALVNTGTVIPKPTSTVNSIKINHSALPWPLVCLTHAFSLILSPFLLKKPNKTNLFALSDG